MKTLPQYFMPVPDRYRDGSFDVVVRDASSAVIFWDLSFEPPFEAASADARLVVWARAESSDSDQRLDLHDHAGHLLLPLLDEARDYRIDLGWLDTAGKFTALSGDTITLPNLPPNQPARLSPPTSSSLSTMRHARYGHLTSPVERRGFRPGLAS